MISSFGRGFDSLQLHKNKIANGNCKTNKLLFAILFLWSWRDVNTIDLVL